MNKMSKIQKINVETLTQKLRSGEVILVDVRETNEFADNHIPNAISLPLTCIDEYIEQLEEESRAIVFHCQQDKRGEFAAEKAVSDKLKGKTIYSLMGGIEAWQQAGLPIISKDKRENQSLPLNRQVFIAVGSLVFILSLVSISGFTIGSVLTLLISCGLLVAGFTGWCGMALLLQKMPWNR